MKTLIKYIFITLVGVNLTSCLNLDYEQSSKIDVNSMWKTDEDCKSAVYGAYGQMRIAFSSAYAYWGDYRTGMWSSSMALGADITYMCSNTITSSNSGADWTALYKLINLSNLILKYTPDIEFKSETEKGWVLGNAYFLRALSYYYVARVWGDAPLVLTGYESENDPGLYPSKSAAADIYKQVEKDIKEALANMPETLPSGTSTHNTASLTSVNMLKADYYMWMAKTQGMDMLSAYSSAQEGLDAVFSNTALSLMSNYADVFDVAKKEANTETIFTIHFSKDEYEGGFAKNYLFTASNVVTADENLVDDGTIAIGTEGGIAQRVTFDDKYENILYENASDQRAQVTYRVIKPSTKTYKWINKYVGEWVLGSRYYSSDIIFYRLSDAILLQAELYNDTGFENKAIDELNKIAKRAYGVDNYYPYGSDDINELILQERIKEFAAEGKLWWDFIRMGVVFKIVPTLTGRENETDVLLWPIHNNAKNKNPNL